MKLDSPSDSPSGGGRDMLLTGGLAAILASTCFDDAKANVEALTRATKNAGYPSTVVGVAK